MNPPPYYPYPIPPPPPPPTQPININVGGTDKEQDKIDESQNQAIAVLSAQLANIAQAYTIQLGESEGTAYYGHLGKANADAIIAINHSLSSLLGALQRTVTDEQFYTTLTNYSTISGTTDLVIQVRDELSADFNNALSGLSADIQNGDLATSAEVSAIVSAVIKENEETYDFLSPIDQELSTFLDGI